MSDLAEQLIDEEEGASNPLAYMDSRGFLTIARGCLIDKKVPGAEGLCPAARAAQDAYTLGKARSLAAAIVGFDKLNEVRQAVLVSMCFQLGNLHGWPDFRTAILTQDYSEAARQMLFAHPPAATPSSWSLETPTRCDRAALMMRTGQWVAHGAPLP